jgi:hypothetical protein
VLAPVGTSPWDIHEYPDTKLNDRDMEGIIRVQRMRRRRSYGSSQKIEVLEKNGVPQQAQVTIRQLRSPTPTAETVPA